MPVPAVFEPVLFADHALLDSGNAEKIERFGEVVLRRPDPQALWNPRLPQEAWTAADLVFVRESDRGGRWEPRVGAHSSARSSHPSWEIGWGKARFHVRPTPFKHVGIFPEQAANWQLLLDLRDRFGTDRPRLLDLFGYTGAASIVAAQVGYEVTHVDASKTSLAWAAENAALSGLASDAVRWVLDDALAYAKREARRGRRYHAILLDPPHFGRGPKGETWRFEDGIAPLIEAVGELLESRVLVILSTYAIGCSPLALSNMLATYGAGRLEGGELALREEGDGGRWLPAGFCARWSRGIER